MATPQLKFKLKPRFRHGGARPGAGRPRRSRLQSHVPRSEFLARHPLHLTLRLRPGLPSLRGRAALRAVRRALILARTLDLRVVHYAILANHVHLLVESTDKAALARQMQSLGIALAKNLNRAWARRGAVLVERYHRVELRSALQAKRALAYVLQNESRHRERQGRGPLPRPDAYSSSATFTRWRELLNRDPPAPSPALHAELHGTVDPPRTWLLARGWRRA